MSRRWALTPASRSLPAPASSRFWVLSSTPSPALEMYSSLLQSSVTLPSTLSRKDWAVAHCAASRRPAMTTTSSAPKSIASILSPCVRCGPCGRLDGLSERDAAPPIFLEVLVGDGVHEPPNQVQPQTPRFALFDGQRDVGIRCPRHIERLDIIIGQRHFD